MQLQMSFVRGGANKIEGMKLLELCWGGFGVQRVLPVLRSLPAGGFAVPTLISCLISVFDLCHELQAIVCSAWDEYRTQNQLKSR